MQKSQESIVKESALIVILDFFLKLFKYIHIYFKFLNELRDSKVEDIIGNY